MSNSFHVSSATPTRSKSVRRSHSAVAVIAALVASSLAVVAPSSAQSQCANDTSAAAKPTAATSISDTSTEFFVGELLDAIADEAPTQAQDCAPEDFEPFENLLPEYVEGMELGLWVGQAGLWGTFNQDFSGSEMVWSGSIAAEFQIGISDDRSASGTWEYTGDGDIAATVPDGDMTADQHFVGSGAVSGDSDLLVLNGTSVTTGTFTGTVNGFTISDSIDSAPTANPPHEVRVRAVACGEAYGDWTYSIEEGIEASGFNASFDGVWSAFRDDEAGAELARADYLSGVSTEAKNLFALTANYILVYNQFTDDFRTWDTQSVFNFMAALEAALNAFRNFSDCDIEFFGQDNVTTAMNALTFLMQGVLVGADSVDQPLTGAEFREMLHVAVRTGAIGAAAPNPAQAVKAEQGLVDAGQRVLSGHAESGTEIDVTEDTIEVMRLGSLMGWTYEVAGYRFPAKPVYAEYQAAVATADGGS